MIDRLNPGKHTKRAIRFLELWHENGWRVKIYGICQFSETPRDALVEIAKNHARELLLYPAETEARYGVAFIAVHEAAMFNQIIIDWWERENELRHHVFKAEAATPQDFQNITASGEAFCVWELCVIGFERDAWMTTVLNSSRENRVAVYLNERLNEDC